MQAQNRPYLVLPRPGEPNTHGQTPPSIPAPSEAAMTSTFGSLLPPADYLTTPHGRTAYYVYPPLQSTPVPMRVLMVHGIQTPALGLQPLASALRSSFPSANIALFDHWGHGLSDTPLLPHTPALFHELIDLVLAALNWPSAHFIGYSFGGATVVGYAVSERGAKKVASMALVAPAGLIDSASFPDEARTKYLPVGGSKANEKEALKWILDFLEGGELIVPSDWKERVARGEVVAEAIKEWEMRAHEGHLASVMAIFRDGGVLDNQAAFLKAKKTGIKTLAILGEQDAVCSAQNCEDVGMNKEDVIVIPQAGHALVRQRVPEVAQHIEKFWKSL